MWLLTNKVRLLGLTMMIGALLQTAAQAQLVPEAQVGNRPVRSMQTIRWQQLSAHPIDVQFPAGQQALAENTARLAAKAYYELSRQFNHTPDSRLMLQVYPGRAAFAQRDETPNPYMAGFNYVDIAHVYFPGTQQAYYGQIKAALIRLFITNLYYGSADQVAFQNRVLLYLPEWFLQGISDYLGEGWTAEDEVLLRGTPTRGLHNLVLDPTPSEMQRSARKSLWHFVERKYGRRKVIEVIFMTRLSRSIEGGLQSVLGMGFSRLTNLWLHDAKDSYAPERLSPEWDAETGPALPAKQVLVGSCRHPQTGEFALLLHKEGIFRLYYWKPGQKHLRKGGFRSGIAQAHSAHQDLWLPMDWRPDGKEIVFYLPGNGRGKLVYVSPEFGRSQAHPLPTGLDEIYELAYHPTQTRLAFAALGKGQTDIYLTPAGSLRPTPVTQDLWDDRHPRWTQDGEGLFFSSNRGFSVSRDPSDDERPKGMEGYEQPLNLYQLPQLDAPFLMLLSYTKFYAEWPVVSHPDGLYALSLSSGLPNLAFVSDETQALQPITDYREGLLQLHPGQQDWYAVVAMSGRRQLRRLPLPDPTAQLQPEANPERAHWQRKYERLTFLRDRHAQMQATTPTQQPDKAPHTDATDEDTDEDSPTKAVPSDTTRRSIRFYVFDEEDTPPPRTKNRTFGSVIGRRQPAAPKLPPELFPTDSVALTPAYRAKTGLLMRGVQSDIVYDPYAGHGADLRLMLQDAQAYNRVVLGIRPYSDFRSIDVRGRYQLLRYRVQPFAALQRQTRFFNEPDFMRFNSVQLQLGTEYVLNQYLQVGVEGSYSHLTREDLNLLDIFDLDGTDRVLTTGLYLRYSRVWYQDHFTLRGTQMRIRGLLHAAGSAGAAQTVQADIRKYIPLFGHTVLAMRAHGGYSGGGARQQFMMGGVDNWVFSPAFDNQQDIPLRDEIPNFLLNEHVGPLRGINLNSRNGTQYALAHVEWRLPLTRMFINGLNSNPLYNVQFQMFYELGTSWRTGNPLSQRNPIDASTIRRGPITAVVQSLRSPFIQVFGMGFRTLVLGYFTRFDISWPVEEDAIVGTRFTVGLGKDF